MGIVAIVSAIILLVFANVYEVPADKSPGPSLLVIVLFGLIFMWATVNWMGIQWAS